MRLAVLGAATAAVLAFTVTEDPARRAPEPAPAATGPTLAIGISNDAAQIVRAADVEGGWVARTPFTLDLVHAVAGRGDDRTFYVATQTTKPCGGAIYRMTVDSAMTLVTRTDGHVHALALARDGSRLAYSLVRNAPGATCGAGGMGPQQVRVRDLATGAERAWTARENHGANIRTLSWSPDGRYVAYALGGVARLDTTGPATPLADWDSDSTRVHRPGSPGTCTAGAPAYLPSGELAVVLTCGEGFTPTSAVAVFDPETRTVGRELFALPEGLTSWLLAFDPGGDRAFLKLSTGWPYAQPPNAGLYLWERGSGLRLLANRPRIVPLSW